MTAPPSTPSGTVTAVSVFEGTSAKRLRPNAVAARRVASAFRWCRSKIWVRPSFDIRIAAARAASTNVIAGVNGVSPRSSSERAFRRLK